MHSGTARPHELATLLDDPAWRKIKVLSLDCFDTLLWRAGATPHDVFFELGGAPASPFSRVGAESDARRWAVFKHRRGEVTLHDIYRELDRTATEEAIAGLVRRELDAERRHCFVFPPVLGLIREAKRRGLRVIVVSDTYLAEPELAALIAAVAGPEVRDLVDRIFCSSTIGRSKTDGLFEDVLPRLGAQAHQVLHLGDNESADVLAPRREGVRTVHLRQFDEATAAQLRVERSTASVFDAGIRTDQSCVQCHRAPLAIHAPRYTGAAARFGFCVLGPIFHGFATWVRQETISARREHQTGDVHVGFLMRDGHLAHEVFATLPDAGGATASKVELSRFTAWAASFTTEDAILRYLARFARVGELTTMCRQLLLTETETAAIVAEIDGLPRPAQKLARLVKQRGLVRRIIARAHALGDRMYAYLQRVTGVRRGDRLLFVDLGYAGTVQSVIAPVLRERFGVEVEGRYLLLRDKPGWRRDKRGLIDPRHYDPRAINSLCKFVSVIEQFSGVMQGSVVDYSADGEPVRDQIDFAPQQYARRSEAQAACLDYARSFRDSFHTVPAAWDEAAWRQSALVPLARLLFFPSREETDLVERFEHDMNMGHTKTLPLFDDAAARAGMLRRGPMYVNSAPRMYLPAEFRREAPLMNHVMLNQLRFEMDIRPEDHRQPLQALPVLTLTATGDARSEVAPSPTHDGFACANIPVQPDCAAVGVQWGRVAKWIELAAVELVPLSEVGVFNASGADPLVHACIFQGIEVDDATVLHCREPDGFMMVPLPPQASYEPSAIRVVFRVIGSARPPATAEEIAA